MTDTQAPPTRSFPRWARNLLLTVLIVGALAGLWFTGQAATTGDNATSLALPDSVDRLIPASGDEVLAQSKVGIDLAIGYDAYLIVNGTEVREGDPGMTRDMGLGLIQFQPGEGTEVESLLPQKNCVIAMVWKQADGMDSAEPVNWCFEVT